MSLWTAFTTGAHRSLIFLKNNYKSYPDLLTNIMWLKVCSKMHTIKCKSRVMVHWWEGWWCGENHGILVSTLQVFYSTQYINFGQFKYSHSLWKIWYVIEVLVIKPGSCKYLVMSLVFVVVFYVIIKIIDRLSVNSLSYYEFLRKT